MPTKHDGPTSATSSNQTPDSASLRDSAKSRLYVLRRAVAEDLEQLNDLEREVFPTLWPPTNFAREIKKTGQAVLVSSVQSAGAQSPPGGRSVSLVERVVGGIKTLATPGITDRQIGDGVAGWAIVWFVAGEAHIASIGVAESDRRRGVGELLVLGAIEAAAANDCDELTLEVRESNDAAQALYRKYGFEIVGERKGYYVDDNEDALIMTTPDIREPDYAAKLAELAADHSKRWVEAGIRFARD
jgi:[ribosomal protein S18]-alanine N-acetyltransferase